MLDGRVYYNRAFAGARAKIAAVGKERLKAKWRRLADSDSVALYKRKNDDAFDMFIFTKVFERLARLVFALIASVSVCSRRIFERLARRFGRSLISDLAPIANVERLET
ncbi:MAG: hypothetical protein LBF86_00815 [Helicobacteraceae bacterium]|nr:hypothetical protein [Helicobacteraceae bacterium]